MRRAMWHRAIGRHKMGWNCKRRWNAEDHWSRSFVYEPIRNLEKKENILTCTSHHLAVFVIFFSGEVKIAGNFFATAFSILEDQPMDMLLGLDMLKRHQVQTSILYVSVILDFRSLISCCFLSF